MTVNTTPVEINYTGNASTTVFALPFAFAANAHVKVYLGGVLQGSGYSITGAGNPSGGTLTMTTAPGTGVALKARRVTPLTQDIDVVNNATVFASSLETGLDYALLRQQEEAFDRAALGVFLDQKIEDLIDTAAQEAADIITAPALANIDAREDEAIAAVAAQQSTSVAAVVTQQTASAAAVVVQQTASIADVDAAGAARVVEILATSSDGFYVNTYAATLPKGVLSGTIGGTPVAGATPGTYALTAVGGSITGVTANLVVTSPTSASVVITNRGLGSGTTPPTWANPVGANLPGGTTLTAVVGSKIADQDDYVVLSADGLSLQAYYNNAGTPAVLTGIAMRTQAYIDARINTAYTTRSGYWGGIMSLSGLLGVGFRGTDSRPIFGNGGDVVSRIETVEGGLSLRNEGRSGILAGIILPNGMLPFAVEKPTGRALIDGRALALEMDAVKASLTALIASPLPDFPTLAIACWGTSMTAAGSSGDWPSKLATDTGLPVYNGGQGGQGGRGIAGRQGGLPPLITLTGNSIPATTTAVTVTAIVGTPCAASSSTSVTIAGIVGDLARDSGSGHTFTRSTAGTATAVPARSPVTVAEGQAYRGQIMIAEIGTNSAHSASADPMSPAQVVAALQGMVDFTTSRVKRVIVWGPAPATTDTAPQAAAKVSQAAAVAAAFPEFWLDLMAWMRTTAPATIGSTTVNDPFTVIGLTPTGTDLSDIAAGNTPTSFRSDAIHLNSSGGTAAAYRIRLELQLKGYI